MIGIVNRALDTMDVLTLLIHLGYLAYDSEMEEVWIPNIEVADSFRLAVRDEEWEGIGEVQRSIG